MLAYAGSFKFGTMKKNIYRKEKPFIFQMQPWIGKEEQQAVSSYLKSGGWLTEFKKTEELETMISQFTGAKYTCMVNNGTVSLFIALQALGIGKGDEVIVPNYTMIASANAVILAGAKPVLVDINNNNLCIDLKLAEKAITKKTKALMFVSINGRSQDMNEVISFCKKNKLYLIEDAAQSLGSRWKGKHLGTFGEIGSFSFSTPKIITTGQGGALVTNDSSLIKKIRQIKDFGRTKSGVDKYITLGYNFKFTDLQAVIGIEQMKKLPLRVKRKKEIYALYAKTLSSLQQIQFIATDLEDTSPWLIDILVEKKGGLIKYLLKNQIGSRTFYPPVHTQAPYKQWPEYNKTHFPISEEISSKGFTLPSSSFLTDKTILQVCETIKKFYSTI